MLTKQEAFLGRGAWAENSSAKGTGEGLCHVAHSLVFYGDGISSGLSLANPSESGVLPDGACIHSAKIASTKKAPWEVGRTYIWTGVSSLL